MFKDSSVVARKLGRKNVGIDHSETTLVCKYIYIIIINYINTYIANISTIMCYCHYS